MIDGSDYTLIDNAFNNQTANLSTAASVAASTARQSSPQAAQPQVAQVAAVPESGTLALLDAGTLGMLPRRRSGGSAAVNPMRRV